MKKLILMTFLLSLLNTSKAGMATYSRWTKAEINVCFAGKEANVTFKGIKPGFANWKDDQKDFITDVISKEFVSFRTGYSFVGFKDCKNTIKPDLIILRKSSFSSMALMYRGLSTIGKTVTIPVPTYPSARGVVVFTLSGINHSSTLVHEFGHALGLMHEHIHPDAKNHAQAACNHYSKDSVKSNRYMYSEFDENSVMNYCKIEKDAHVGLSQGDIEQILKLFNYTSIEKV